MKKGQMVVLLVSLMVSLGILAVLYALSPLSKEMYRASFERNFTGDLVAPDATMDLEFNSFYIAGYSDDQLYLGNATAPFHLVQTNLALTDSQHVMLRVTLDSVSDYRRFRLSVVPPHFYLAHGTQPVLLKGTVSDWTAGPFVKDEGYYFSDAVAVGTRTFALRAYNKASKSYELVRKTPDGFVFHDDLLEKQIDGLFCVDGKLSFNKKLQKLVYLYFYRNQFIVADTNLALNYRGHTIDTFSHARIKVAKIGNGEESMIAAPPVVINGLSCTDGDSFYVQSGLLARNEDAETFKASATIDCYRLTDGKYMGSFHIPLVNKEHMLGFQVVGDKLFAVFGKYLVGFTLNPVVRPG